MTEESQMAEQTAQAAAQGQDVQQEHQKYITGLGDWHRSQTCGELTLANNGQEVCLMGWVQYRRDHGGLIFVDLRDRSGLMPPRKPIKTRISCVRNTCWP